MGCIKIDFWLHAVNDSGELISMYCILNKNKSTNIRQIASWRIYWDLDKSFNKKKTGDQISLDCPFTSCSSTCRLEQGEKVPNFESAT
jgi:hypothetical protein